MFFIQSFFWVRTFEEDVRVRVVERGKRGKRNEREGDDERTGKGDRGKVMKIWVMSLYVLTDELRVML